MKCTRSSCYSFCGKTCFFVSYLRETTTVKSSNDSYDDELRQNRFFLSFSLFSNFLFFVAFVHHSQQTLPQTHHNYEYATRNGDVGFGSIHFVHVKYPKHNNQNKNVGKQGTMLT